MKGSICPCSSTRKIPSLESFYHLAEQHELAERVKPSTRRSGRTESDVEAQEPAGSAEVPDGPGEEPEPDEPAVEV